MLKPSAPGAVLKFGVLVVLVWACIPGKAFCQTPSPLQEWQYSGGIALMKLFQPNVPEWSGELGLGIDPRPLYEGANTYRVLVGPVIDLRYEDLAFASVGEGLGVNFLRGDHYRVGVALGYDLGRHVSDDLDHLRGMGNISSAPFVKLFASYAVSKEFPLVVRVDARQFAGGANGMVGDLGVFMPLPGSSEKLVMFAGPSVTFVDRLYAQTEFGVSVTQSAASRYPLYIAHGGFDSAGFGFSATRFFGKRWLVNVDLSANRLLGSASESPVTQARVQNVFALSGAYRW